VKRQLKFGIGIVIAIRTAFSIPMPMPIPIAIPNDGFMLNSVANMTVHRIAADILDATEYIRRYAVDNFTATLKPKKGSTDNPAKREKEQLIVLSGRISG